MKSFAEQRQQIEEARAKSVVFTFGRFNPITKGHEAMIEYVMGEAKKRNAEGMIFTSQSNDPKKNPLSYKDKTGFLRKFFPKANIVVNTKIKTAFDALQYLSDKGYKNVIMVVGGDRVADFEKAVRPYVKHKDPSKSYDFDHFDVIDSGKRVKGVSGTDMRKHASNGDFEEYMKGMPKSASAKDAEAIYNAVRKGMGLKEYLEFGTDETTRKYKSMTPGEEGFSLDEDSVTRMMMKELLPKKLLHALKRAIHGKKYKEALKIYKDLKNQVRKDPEAFKKKMGDKPGMRVMNIDGIIKGWAAQAVGIKVREFDKILDRNTRYESFGEWMEFEQLIAEVNKRDEDDPCWEGYTQVGTKMKDGKKVPNCVPIEESWNVIEEEITRVDLQSVEKFADKLFAKVGIDVEFTRHFLDRCNDSRNGKDITVAELIRLFKQSYQQHGKKIAKLGPDAQAVLNDLQTDLNLPFVLKWNKQDQELELVSKTIMRKKDFKTSNQKLKV